MDTETEDRAETQAAFKPRLLNYSPGPGTRTWPSLAVLALWTGLIVGAVYSALLSAYYLRFKFGPLLRLFPLPDPGFSSAGLRDNLGPVVLMWVLVLFITTEPSKERQVPFEDEAVHILKGSILGSLGTLALFFMLRRFYASRLMIVLLFPIATTYLLLVKKLEKGLQSWFTFLLPEPPRLLVLGNGKASLFLRKRLAKLPHLRCFFHDALSMEETLELMERERVTEVILTQIGWNRQEILSLADVCEASGVTMKLVPNLLEDRMGEIQVDRSMVIPMFRFYHTSLSGEDALVKRLFDVLFSSVFLAIFSIPLLLIAAFIKLDSSGPIFFKQRRVGCKGRPFDVFKFRTMVEEAPALLEDLKHLNERQGPVFKIKNDPRVTRVGRWLRRLSLDEVPQFINVLKGEMSVVGPRPPLPSEVALYDAAAMKRLNVLPGITGLWQVSGRADVDFNQMTALDIFYLEHWSLGLDLKIILKTPAAVFSSRGAY